jgi:alpha-2-macroglobulin
MTVEVWLDGQKRQEVRITKDNLFTFDNKFVLAGDGRDRPGRTTSKSAASGRGRSISTPT